MARERPETPASNFFEELNLRILSTYIGKTVSNIGDAVRIIAHIGGFRPCPSAPRAGVKSLWLGLRRLDGMEVGWQLAMATLAAKDTGQD